jgi:ABC-type uncharacterized transport system substrate-binding protein
MCAPAPRDRDAYKYQSMGRTYVSRRRPLLCSRTAKLQRETTEIGGLMSYGSVRVDRYRRAAIYVGKISNGAKPADLPIEQPTKCELVINIKTAKSLNLEIPVTCCWSPMR